MSYVYELMMYGSDGIVTTYHSSKQDVRKTIKQFKNGEYPTTLTLCTIAALPHRQLITACLNHFHCFIKREVIREWAAPKDAARRMQQYEDELVKKMPRKPRSCSKGEIE